MEKANLPSLQAPIELDPTEANWWWEKRAKLAMGVWGKPVLYGGIPNIESLAASITEATGLEIVYEAGWWYMEPSLGAYVQTTEFRIEALFRRMVTRAADESDSRSMKAITIPLVTLAPQVVKAAKSILGVGPEFWEGKTRIVGGVKKVNQPLGSIPEFIQTHVEEGTKEPLPLFQAYERYVLFCKNSGRVPMEKTIFRTEFGAEIHERFGLRMRNDLKVGSKTTRGWKRVCLKG